MELKKAIDRFLEYCELDRNLSQKTVRMYSYYMNFFLNWAGNTKQPKRVEKIDEEVVREFRLYLSREYFNPFKGKLKKQTQNYFLVALRSFFRFLVKKKYNVLSPEQIELGKPEKREIGFLLQNDVKNLMCAPNTKKIIGLRDRAILETLFSTGLRISELVGLNRDSINLKDAEFSVIGKGRKTRVVFLSNTARQWLAKYLEKRKDNLKALFIAYSGPKPKHLTNESMRLSVRSIERMVEKYRKIAQITKPISPHTLRHSFATDLLNNGADVESVKDLLGHKNISTTQIYLHVTNPKLREIHKKYHSGN